MNPDEANAMSNPTNPDDPRRQRLDAVIGAFLVAVDAGENPDPANGWPDIPIFTLSCPSSSPTATESKS